MALWSAGQSLPSWSQVMQAVGHMNLVLVGLACVAQAGSLWLFACQQQVLFAAIGVRVPIRSALAITYTRSALSMTFPAGAVVSALFAVRQYQRFGASRASGVTVMVLSGVMSALGLGAMYGLWLGASWSIGHPWSAVLVVIAALSVAGAATTAAHSRRSREPDPEAVTTRDRGVTGVVRGGVTQRVSALVQARLAEVRALPGRSWTAGVGLAAANWSADLACLVLVSTAFGSQVALVQLGLLYLGVQLVRQIPLSPGGIGVVEASLVVGLVLLGVGPATAAATALAYRLLSCWLVVPIGLATWVAMPRPPADPIERPAPGSRIDVTVGAPNPCRSSSTTARQCAAASS